MALSRSSRSRPLARTVALVSPWALLVAPLVVGAGVGCTALLGVTDVPEPAEGGSSDASALDASPCGETATNPHNCGRCGHDCLGGACSKAACQPIALVPADSGVSPFSLAQDDASLYWTDNNNSTVESTSKTTRATLIVTDDTLYPSPIAVDDTRIYWGDASGVWRCPKSGCPQGPILVAQDMIIAILNLAIDEANVYWTEGNGVLLTASKSKQDQFATTLWGGDAGSETAIVNVATDGQQVYFTASDGLLRGVAVDGSAPFALGTMNRYGSYGIALDTENVYWSVGDPSRGLINEAAKSSHALSKPPLASGQHEPGGMATDGTNLYWLATTTATSGIVDVVGCALASCTPKTPASGYASSAAIVVDQKAIYWAVSATTEATGSTTNGSIWMLAK
jgi:hypothetical protein